MFAVLFLLLSVAQESAVCCMAFTPDSGGITVMDTKGHLYPLEVETEYIGFDHEDFTDDFREGSEMDVSIQLVPSEMVWLDEGLLKSSDLVVYLLLLFYCWLCHTVRCMHFKNQLLLKPILSSVHTLSSSILFGNCIYRKYENCVRIKLVIRLMSASMVTTHWFSLFLFPCPVLC